MNNQPKYRITLLDGTDHIVQELKGQDIFRGKIYHKNMDEFFFEEDVKRAVRMQPVKELCDDG